MGSLWKNLFEIYSNIDDQKTSSYLSIIIKIANRDYFKRNINELIIFYSVEKDNLNLVR